MPLPCGPLLSVEHLPNRRDERLERANFAEVRERLRAIGIVETEDRRLREEVGGAEARRMIGVAFDLRRAALVALDQEADAGPGKRHRRRVEERLARNQLLGLPDVRNDALRSAGACRR